MKPRERLWTPQEDATLIVRINAGWSRTQIATALGRPYHGVEGRLRKLAQRGLPVHRPDPETDCRGLTDADAAWMAYWRQPRAQRRAQEGRHAAA
jgi:hypothetical protein